MEPIRLTNIGARGVNTSSDPLHIDLDELTKAQNAEHGFAGAQDALMKRPGMTVISDTPVSGAIRSAFDIPFEFRSEKTPYLYAAFASGSTYKWAKSPDGVTWTGANTPALPRAQYASAATQKAVTLNGLMYFIDTDWRVHEWDGAIDRIVGTFPPGTIGTLLATPAVATITSLASSAGGEYSSSIRVSGDTFITASAPTVASSAGAGADTWSYKIVTIYSTGHGAASASGSVATSGTAVSVAFPVRLTLVVSPLYANTQNVNRYDIYRTAAGGSGLTNGLIGSVTPLDSGGLAKAVGATGFEHFIDTGLTGDGSTAPASATTTLATSYTYKLVARNGTAYSIASAALTVADGPVTLTTTGAYVGLRLASFTPVVGATSYDVYRTAGGATQGKIGTIALSAGNPTTGNGSGLGPYAGPSGGTLSAFHFSDGGLVGDASGAPTGASGLSAALPAAVVDSITDDSFLYFATIDDGINTPYPGRILRLNVITGEWYEISKYYTLGVNTPVPDFPTGLAFYNGSLVFTGFNTTTGNTYRLATTSYPNPLGGIWAVQTSGTGVGFTGNSPLVEYAGDLYFTAYPQASGSASSVAKYTEGSGINLTFHTHAGTVATNRYTALYVFNGRLFAAWSSGTGATTSGTIESYDGISWITEALLGTNETIVSFREHNGVLFACSGALGTDDSVLSRVLKRYSQASWGAVYDPADSLTGVLGVVYT